MSTHVLVFSKSALLSGVLVTLVACAQVDSVRKETPRAADAAANPKTAEAVRIFQLRDPDASFTFYNGHVDSFATSAKPTVPSYAVSILKELGLSTEAQTPRTLTAPTAASEKQKSARDLDAESDIKLPTLPEEDTGKQYPSKGRSDATDESKDAAPKEETRIRPPKDPQRLVEWKRPDAKTLKLETKAADAVLWAFLAEHEGLFEVTPGVRRSSMRAVDYQVGPYFRKARYEQFYAPEEKLLYGQTLVHFDVNWNVIGISRMIMTREKLAVSPVDEKAVPKDRAISIASQAFRDCKYESYETLRAERTVDAVRRLRVWDVELLSDDGDCHWRTIIDAATGKVLNVTDLIDRAYTDAKVNRWYFSGGDLFNANQIVSTGIYTRNDRRLEHDFFYMMNDHRCEGDPETSCSATSHSSTWCEEAHGSYSGDSYIRATRRSNRDFDQYYPGGASETFAETNAYYWGRSFAQWLKSSLDALGVLPSSASNFPRVLIITDSCRSGSVHNSTYQVTTDDNKGEGTNVIRLAHRNPSGPSNHNAACEGGGCFDNPSNLHHEMNHFFLKRYYNVGSDLDCGSANQLKFTHEGILGTAVPHAYWHYYYGVGYNPSSTNKLYFSNSTVGRVHTSNTNRMTIGNYLCVNNTDDPYTAGRVVGQALWEFYHGKKVDGSTISNTWYPSTDRDFNVLVYWAADLQASSTYKDRYEFANRIMEILDKHSNWSSSGKQDYCAIFAHHELDPFINSDYCN
jgi:hypothetical protein